MNSTTETFTLIICAECGQGNYRHVALTHTVRCDSCGHDVDFADFTLEDGESLEWESPTITARLGYVVTAD